MAVARKVSSKKSVTKNVVEPVVEPVVSVEQQIKALMVTVDSQIKELKETKVTLKTILTSYQKEIKESRNKKKRNKRDPTKEYVPHGFTKPVNISPELSGFLGVDKDALVARPSVTKAIAKYIKENGLANPKDGSIFTVDGALKKVLGEPRFLIKSKKPELGMGYSFGSLQKYLVPHFQKQ